MVHSPITLILINSSLISESSFTDNSSKKILFFLHDEKINNIPFSFYIPILSILQIKSFKFLSELIFFLFERFTQSFFQIDAAILLEIC